MSAHISQVCHLRGPDGRVLHRGTERSCAAAAAGRWPGCYVGVLRGTDSDPYRRRALVWESEADSHRDTDGERAIAEIVEVRS